MLVQESTEGDMISQLGIEGSLGLRNLVLNRNPYVNFFCCVIAITFKTAID